MPEKWPNRDEEGKSSEIRPRRTKGYALAGTEKNPKMDARAITGEVELRSVKRPKRIRENPPEQLNSGFPPINAMLVAEKDEKYA